jgi:ferredoxin-NADP reductase
VTNALFLSPWRAAELIERSEETPRGANLVFAVDGWPGHRAGQHVDLRLTGEDGYQAQRSYSIASAPEPGVVTLTVERLDDGEVPPYLVDEMAPGDAAEIRGPIGDWFVWSPSDNQPLLLLAGGFGLAPLMSMLRHRATVENPPPARLIVSVRSSADLPYALELERLERSDPTLEVSRVITQPRGGELSGARRLDQRRLSELAFAPAVGPSVFVCGPTGFVETVARGLVKLGHDPAAIRTERFGATGEAAAVRAA